MKTSSGTALTWVLLNVEGWEGGGALFLNLSQMLGQSCWWGTMNINTSRTQHNSLISLVAFTNVTNDKATLEIFCKSLGLDTLSTTTKMCNYEDLTRPQSFWLTLEVCFFLFYYINKTNTRATNWASCKNIFIFLSWSFVSFLYQVCLYECCESDSPNYWQLRLCCKLLVSAWMNECQWRFALDMIISIINTLTHKATCSTLFVGSFFLTKFTERRISYSRALSPAVRNPQTETLKT